MDVHIKKIKTLPDAQWPDAWLPSDYETVKNTPLELFKEPEVGKPFVVGGFRSSTVVEIIDDHTFKTLNSIYEWKIIEGN
jgi:hypothetical protein